MLKKSLAWVISLALLLGTVSGLSLIAAADEPVFAYASYISGEPLYKNATQGVYSSEGVQNLPINPRNAVLMPNQNNQIGINIDSSVGLGSSVTVEIKFQGTADNQSETRLGMAYQSDQGGTDYGTMRLMGYQGMEELSVDETKVQLEDDYTLSAPDADGWRVLTIPLANADYSKGGSFNLVKWSWDNGATTSDGWYIQYILLYDTGKGRPSDEALYIRENTWGVIDFTGAEVEKELLSYTIDEYASIVEFDGANALKIAGNDGFHFHMIADDVDQPAVKATDANVTVMLEVFVETTDWNDRFCLQTTDKFEYGRGHGDNAANGFAGYPFNPGAWYVMRFDVTDNNTTDFQFGTWVGSHEIYIRKAVVCRTELVNEFASDAAFINFDEPYARYSDFQDVLTDSYKITWNLGEQQTGDTYTIAEVEGKTAFSAPSGYLYIDVDDAFTKNAGADVADLAFTFTYLDKEGNLSFSYNIEGDGFHYEHIAMGNTGEWKTATVYVDNAKLNNGGNGKDMRINLGANTVLAGFEIAIGADKAALNALLAQAINTAVFTPESVANYQAAKTAALAVGENKYATKAQVEGAITNLQAAIDGLVRSTDPRFTIVNASWDKDGSDGDIVVFDGWNCFKYEPKSGKFMGIGDPDGILNDSASVTYEWEIFFDTDNGNDRCFMGFGEVNGWHGVEEGAPSVDEDGYAKKGNGFAQAGQWGAVPAPHTWGKITIQNDHYDPTKTDGGCITKLGSWVDNGDFYVRSVRVFDTNDPTKYILLQFNEDVNELILSGGDADVQLVEKDGEQAWVIPSGWKALNINLDALLADGTLTTETKKFVVKLNYWLDETTNGNELLMIKHYNPDGTGNNDNKNEVCEHQQNHGELTKRNQWVQYKFVMDDALFDAATKTLNITYGNGEFIYIRGVEVYEVDENGEMVSAKPARWGVIVPDAAADFDHPTYDWEIEAGFQMRVSFSEGGNSTKFQEDNGRKCAIIDDDFLYVNVDDTYITPDDHFIRIDVTHENGLTAHVQYNMITPEGTDTSAEPNLSFYNFHGSHGLHEIVEGANQNQGSFEFSNPLGVIRPTSDTNNDWMVTSIYLNDASFRNAANGNDFRLKTAGLSAISRIEVIKITEEEYNEAKAAIGDSSALKGLIAQVEEKYPNERDIPDALWEVYDEACKFAADFGYRAAQDDIDAVAAELKKAIDDDNNETALGDADGDGKISSTDARLALQLAVDKIKEADIPHPEVLDVDGNGKVDSTDARLILQFSVDKIKVFPVEENA